MLSQTYDKIKSVSETLTFIFTCKIDGAFALKLKEIIVVSFKAQ